MGVLEGRSPPPHGDGYDVVSLSLLSYAEDAPDKVNYEHLARVVSGLQHVITEIADQRGSAPP